ncbi:hypothetical protein L7F22_040740 [Adiantum nelumboides]|nr:hypothetical protein [Adiantum nelumboides]
MPENDVDRAELWPNVMELAKKGKLTKEVLHEAGDCIHLETSWNDSVDSMSVHAYITHCQKLEAIVEEKQRRNNGHEGPPKKSIRIGGKNDATPPRAPPTEEAPSPEVTMEESTTGKKKEPAKGKQKGPAYKLQSNIELATDLKKVLEERILNSKIEFTLGEVLGIAKCKFHEEIIDIIKRKRQTLGEAIHPQVEEGLSKTQGMQLQAKESNVASVGCYQSFGKVRQVQFAEDDEEYQGIPRSHYSRTHWARATTKTLVKIGDLEEPVVALIDHGSEINIMSKNLYNKCKWTMDIKHGWMVKVANNSSDASAFAIGCILAQLGEKNMDFPISYSSRQLNSAEKNYTTTEREGLGMIYAVKKFRHYLLSNKFVFFVDHQALLYLVNKPCSTGRIVRWFIILLEFDFTVVVKKETTHQRADHLSRLMHGEAPIGIDDDLPDAYLFNIDMVPRWSEDVIKSNI